MKALYNQICKAFLLFLLLITLTLSLKAQTTLAKGDIAFTGYFSNGTAPLLNDQFSFVILTNITANTVINFTDNAWNRTSPTTGAFRTGEGTVTYTSGSAYTAGTEILITITGAATATATLVGGASAGTATGAVMPSLSANGDQVIAYQGTSASPTFISAIHMNVYSVAAFPPDIPGGDAVTTTTTDWDGNANTANSCGLPGLGGVNFLTNGVDALWIPGSLIAEKDNARFNCAGPLSTAAQVRAAVNNVANWQTNDNDPSVGPPSLTLPTGCSFIVAVPAPTFTLQPASTTICAGANTSFTITATGATSYQWQVDNGGGFANLSNDATYSNVTTVTLNITNASNSLNGYLYRCVATNGTGSTNSNSATLTVTPLPVNPTLLLKTPATITVADGTPVSATFNTGSGGTGCADDFRYTTNGGASYLPYTPGNNISTTGLAAGSGTVSIEGRRANCSSLCQNSYVALASWIVSPLPAGATTLNAGDIAFSGYIGGNNIAADEFSFVLLRNIGPGTVINFTNNGWLSTNVFRSGEETVTWTSPTALSAGTEIKIAGLTASKSGGGAAGTVTGAALSLSVNGDQILAYRGSTAAPTFISAIHTNVYNIPNGDPVTTTAAVWDGAANTNNASALPTGLTTGVNAIWIGTQGVIGSEFDNSKFGNCSNPAVPGSVAALRAALNNQANWTSSNGGDPASFSLPTNCNYLSILVPTIDVTGTPLSAFTSCSGTASTEQNFVVSGSALTADININAPAGFEISTTSGSGFNTSLTLTQSGGGVPNTTIYVRVTAGATGTPSGNITVASTGVTTINVAVTGTVNPIPATPTITAGGPTTFCAGGSVVLTSSAATDNVWSTGATTVSITVVTGGTYTVVVTTGGCTSATSAGSTVTVNPLPATPTITAGGPTTFCDGGSVILTSSSATGNVWSTGATTPSITVVTSGTYTVEVTSGGCTSATSAGTTVTVNPIPDVLATPTSQSRCSGQAIQAILMSGAVSGTSFDWVRDNVGTIGGSIPASGSGNISGNLVNNTGAPVTVTFTITPTANGCPGTPITATVTVNPLPNATITGSNQYVCQGTNPVLTAGADPNYTYAWGRSLFTNPFTPLGTAQTQVITKSGNYLLTVTNQYGCVDTAMTVMNVADYRFDGNLATGDAVQTGRLNRFAVISTCAAPKACPGTFTTTGSRLYDSYTVTNPSSAPVCATIGINSFCATNIFSVAYTGSYNPASLCTNYLADPGSSFTQSGFYEATIPANGTIVVIVHEVNTSTGCAGYTLTVDVPRETGITVSPNATVCSGTPVTLTAPAANSYLWTPGGGATTQIINVNPPLGTTTYSVQTGYGNVGCTATTTQDIEVNTLPVANSVANQYFCSGTAATVNFTGTPGTTYNWTNTNTAIGLAASGTGDLSFTATNTGGAPITGTITATPVIGTCTGTPITFTISVSTLPTITSVTEDSVCTPGGVVNLAAAGNGNINWYNTLTNGIVVNSGNTYAPNISATTTYYVEALAPPAATVQTLSMPAQSNTFPGNVRGYWFTAPTDFVITSLSVPTTASSAGQSIAVVKFTGNTPPPVFSATTNAFTTVFFTRNNTGSANIPCNIPVAAGEVIGILGYRGTVNSYAPGDYNTTIAGFPVQLQRLGMQFPLTTTDPQNIWREFGPTTSISRIEFEYSASQSCSSTPRVPVTGTVIPTPVATATPASQTVCSGPITTIVLTSDVPSSTFTWTRDNTANVTGIAASGSGDISGTLTNITTVPQTVTFTITPTSPDGCIGASITATVTVQAIPTITCPANITVSNAANQCGNTVTYSSTFTGIPTPTLTYSFTGATTASGSGDGSGSFFNVGTTIVTITATNACGAASCSFNVIVNDTQAPTITCPAPVTVDCPGDVPAPNTGSVIAADNCPGYVVSFLGDVTSNQTCLSRYTITRTYRVTDASGNFTECTQTIVVDDQIPPTITCLAPVTVSCAAAVPAPNIGLVTATDNCGSLGGPVTITWQGDVISAQTCANRYTITRTYRATDDCGNFAECTQIITVNDVTPPTLTCPAPVTVSCASDVPAPNIADVTGVSDNCAGIVTVTHQGDVISAQTCDNRFTVTRTYRATDVCGNFTECTQIITVNDQTPPTLTCPAPITVSCASQVPVPDINLVTSVSDNCAGVVTVTHQGDVISNQTCINRFTITRTYRATDVCGNFAECTQIITVNDVTPPTLVCPAPITVSCAAAVPAPDILLVTGISDNCGITTAPPVVTFVSDVISNQTCANRYTITRTYRVTDACGNFAECTQLITVNDVTPPTLTCPAPVTVSCAAAVPAPNIALVTGVSDNCAGTVTITHVSDVISNQTCANRYTITRTYRATDVCGNSATCTQIITVNDVTPPALTCPAPITVSCASAVPAPNIALVTGVSDNCAGTVTITHVSDVISNQTCTNRYTITRTYRATDVCGNSATCTQIITVNDQTAPVITCPANITVTSPIGSCTAVVNFTPTAIDNCSGTVTIVSSPASGFAFPVGTTTVTSTATDACGNSASCTFTVTVLDGQLPVISAQPANRTVCSGTTATFSVTSTNAVSYQWQLWNGSTWNNISGATGAILTLNNVTSSMNTNSYRVLVNGLCTIVTSNNATLYVNPLPSVSLTASPVSALLPGQNTTITATTNPSGGSFVWFKNGIVVPGFTSATFGPITIDGIGTYRTVYTDPNGCINTSANLVISAQASDNMWVYPNPNTGQFNVRYYNQTGETATLDVYDALGHRVHRQTLPQGIAYSNTLISLPKVAAGVYIVKVVSSTGRELAAKRIVIYH